MGGGMHMLSAGKAFEPDDSEEQALAAGCPGPGASAVDAQETRRLGWAAASNEGDPWAQAVRGQAASSFRTPRLVGVWRLQNLLAWLGRK